MKKLLLFLSVSFIGASSVLALPDCKSDSSFWNNCFGTYNYENGDKYVGEYKDGMANGNGIYTHDGNKYVGEFKNGTLTGQGILTYKNGDKYIGEVNDGNRHGQGTHTYADGSIKKGIWENGKLLDSEKKESKKKTIQIPLNAYASGSGWLCNSGYTRKGNKCVDNQEEARLIELIIDSYNNGDYKVALKESKLLAERGNPQAQKILGVLYEYGKGVLRDYKKAFYWYKKSAEGGNAYSKLTLGHLYRDGNGVQKNENKALKWYTDAAKNGSAKIAIQSQIQLGLLHANRKLSWSWLYGQRDKTPNIPDTSLDSLIPKNYEKAKYWLDKAYENTYEIDDIELRELIEYIWSAIEGSRNIEKWLNRND